MKALSICVAFFSLLACLEARVGPPDLSFTTVLERYTILDAREALTETGHMLPNGKFQPDFSSTFFYSAWERFDLELISGRPVMAQQLFDAYKRAGILPKLVRSTLTYSIGILDYVIVSTVGGPSPDPRPVIVEQPESQTIAVGDGLFLYATVTPEWLSSYQWFKNGKPIAGGTSDWLSIDETTPADAGRYTLQARIGNQVVTSRPAVIKLLQPVSIRTDLRDQTVKLGKTVAFNVGVSGSGPFTYVWYHHGIRIEGAKTGRLVLRKVSATDAGTYSVQVRNAVSSVLSSTVTLTITP